MPTHLRCTSLVTLALWLLATVPAVAQPGASAPPLPGAPVAVFDEQAIYEQAFAALLASDFAAARGGFGAVVAQATDPERRGAAREMLRLIAELEARQGRLVFGAGGPGPGPVASPPPVNDRDDPDEGRTGIIVSTTMASLYAGVVFSDLADTGDARAITGIITLTTAAGFLASLYGTRDRLIHGGTSEAYSLGLLVGAGNGLLLSSPLGAETSEQWQTAILGGMVLSAGAGFVYGQSVRPTRGQVSFAGTMATMGFATAGLGLVLTLPDVDGDTILLTMAAGLDGGAAAGLYLGRNLTWSTGRARLAWLGALLGGLGGVATSVLLFGDFDGDGQSRAAAGITLGGAWAGLGLAIHLTRNMRPDARYRTASTDGAIVPIALPHGGGLGYAGRF